MNLIYRQPYKAGLKLKLKLSFNAINKFDFKFDLKVILSWSQLALATYSTILALTRSNTLSRTFCKQPQALLHLLKHTLSQA